MRAVIDTNVLVSSLLRAEGNPAAILNLVVNQHVTLCYDSRIVAEYRDVLLRPRFGFRPEDVEALLDFIERSGFSMVPVPVTAAFTDESDKKFYEVAKSAGACLVTGNKRHYPDDPGILTPAEFMGNYSTI